jgi:hypothetical protein
MHRTCLRRGLGVFVSEGHTTHRQPSLPPRPHSSQQRGACAQQGDSVSLSWGKAAAPGWPDYTVAAGPPSRANLIESRDK